METVSPYNPITLELYFDRNNRFQLRHIVEDPTINAARVARRVMQGGHDVPIPKIISRYFKSIANCVAVAREVDRLYLYDNSLDGAPPRLIARASDGEIVRRYGPEPSWMESILASMS
ncbi:MAG TPA: hypothetical protein VE093_38770 [Polyangiaceae bacterium]|nr:hypothetical protein [Polyangiaceae bacterium]